VVCDVTGLPPDCVVHVGVHDSNASYLRYRRAMADRPFSVVSTGTWSIVMNGSAGAAVLQAERDMLANVDVTGTPVVCSRFMGGREYALVCKHLGGALDTAVDAAQVKALIANDVYCLPGWQAGTGPFLGTSGEISGTLPADVPAAALASLYCALVLDYQLDLVAVREQVIIGGAFLKNPLLCALLAQLREGQPVLACRDITGTVVGAAQLTRWYDVRENLHLDAVVPAAVGDLDDYRQRWRDRIAAREREIVLA
jgi:sugar (pentulose or hexulose) kinase